MMAVTARLRFSIFSLSAVLAVLPGFSGGAEAEEPAAESPAETAPSPADASLDGLIDGLSQTSLQEAFRLLRNDYIQHDALSYLTLNRAALQGLLERLEFGAMLLTHKGREARNSPFTFHSEALTDEIGYIRFGKFSRTEITALDTALKDFKKEQPALKSLILDLRSPQKLADFEIASSILSRFRPPSELLFKIRRPDESRPRLFLAREPAAPWLGRTIVLIDRETGNVGEIIAAVLQKRGNCLTIGEPTVGMTVEYRDVPIGADCILRYAVAEVVLSDDLSLFQKGVQPDLVTKTSSKVKQAVFRESERANLADFVFDKQRPRMNEAALVARTDPELDYLMAQRANRQTEWDEPRLRDHVLRQAVDLMRVTAFLPAGEPVNE